MGLRRISKSGGYIFLWLLVLCIVIPMVSGCGSSDEAVVSVATIDGKASKGPVYPGTVKAYMLVGGQKAALIGTAETDPNGDYEIVVVGYTGPVVLEVSGKYRDEATGDPNKQIDPNKPFRALISSTTGTIKAAVTPFTEIAYRRAEVIGKGKDLADPNKIVLDPNTIDQANSEISQLLWVDITRTLPANIIDKDALEADANDAEAMQGIKYALYLAAISKMAYANDIDPVDMISALADQFKDGVLGGTGEIKINDLGDLLVDVVNDPNIVDPNVISLANILDMAQDQSILFDEFYDPNDPNGVTMSGSPTGGETPLDQAKAMVSELRTKALNTETSLMQEGERVASDIETDIYPEFMSFAEMLMVLQAGIGEIFDPNNMDPNSLMDPSNLPFEETASVEGYSVTLTMDVKTGVMLSMLLDPNIRDQWQDPNYWYTFINQGFLDEIMDPNEQAELQDPNLFAGLDPNIFTEMGLDPDILSYLEDPNIDLFYFEAGYSIMQGYYSRGSGTLKISLDRDNGRIDLFKVNGSLGSASLTDFGISLWQDPADPNITGAALHFGKFQTTNIMADSNFVMTVLGGPFAGDMIGEADCIGVNTLYIMGAFQVTNSFSWLGEIRFGDPVLVDPNFEIWSLYMPSKVQLDGAYELPSGAMSFEGTITAEIFNMGELYAYEELGEGGPVDPNMLITFLGTMSVAGEPDMQFTMTLSSAMEGYYSIPNIQFQYGGINIMGTASIVNTDVSESITLDLENQDGLDLHLVAAYTESVGDSLTGSIKKDGILIAYFEIVNNIPRVVYYNGDFETLF